MTTESPGVITVSLISHTNVGKTTLARTLLRRDVGEVLDQAHVTLTTDRFTLVEADGARLDLFDTPGLGDTVRLLGRLRGEANPIGWFLSQVWDRVTNRALWSTQQAIRNVRDEADVVLYLVNAAEPPEEAGYVRHELDLLTWLDRPVLLLLNQTGMPLTRAAPADAVPVAGGGPVNAARHLLSEADELEERWRGYSKPWPIVRDVLALDAFSRCWVQEGELFERLRPMLEVGRRETLDRCQAAWHDRNRAVFSASMAQLAQFLVRAAADREPFAAGGVWPGPERRRAMETLGRRLERETRALIDHLVAAHGLDGRSSHRLAEIFASASPPGVPAVSPTLGAVAGSVLSGALTGLAADLAAGGLTFGGGALLGALIGAAGGAALARGVQVVQGAEPAVTWSPPLLTELTCQAILHYLVVAHYGRGRGPYEDQELPAAWSGLVTDAVRPHGAELSRIWRGLRGASAAHERAAGALGDLVTGATAAVLRRAYPRAAGVLRGLPGTVSGS